MTPEETESMLSKVAVLVEQFDRRCEQTSQAVRQLVQQVPGALQQSADAQLRRLPDAVMRSIEQPVAAYEQRLHDASQQLQEASRTLAMQVTRIEKVQKNLLLKVTGITLASLLLLLAAGVWLSMRYYDEIRSNQVSATLLKAYNQADVTLCEGHLCAKPSRQGKRYGEYVLIESR